MAGLTDDDDYAILSMTKSWISISMNYANMLETEIRFLDSNHVYFRSCLAFRLPFYSAAH